MTAGDAVLFDPSDLVDRLASCGALACEELLDGVRLTDDEAERFRMGEFERADEVEVRCSVTDVGREALAIMDPAARVRDLLSCAPERADLFCATLEFCAEPRSLDEVSALLEEDDRVATIHRSEGRVYPSYFLEKLKAGRRACVERRLEEHRGGLAGCCCVARGGERATLMPAKRRARERRINGAGKRRRADAARVRASCRPDPAWLPRLGRVRQQITLSMPRWPTRPMRSGRSKRCAAAA